MIRTQWSSSRAPKSSPGMSGSQSVQISTTSLRCCRLTLNTLRYFQRFAGLVSISKGLMDYGDSLGGWSVEHHLLVCIKTHSVPEGKRLLMILPSVGGGNCNWPTNAKFSREPRSKRTTLPRGKIKFDMWRVRLEELETGLKLRVQERKNHDGKELRTSIQRLQAQCAGYARSLRGTRTHKISILDLEQNCKLEERERERRKLASSETDNGFTDIKSMNPVLLHDLTHTN